MLFELTGIGIGSGTAATIVNWIMWGMSAATILSLISGVASGGAWILAGAREALKAGGKKAAIAW
ncbi:hypothetical protein H9I32_16620 [Bacillus sp. Xin]|uniref:BacA n=1 Tax=Bacillus sp. Xin1 TaxID=2740676 RepID=A0A7D5DPX0_9BACI|nr:MULTISPECIES: uberolysin/carnocyclin family circular bacteriocin [unclassified Bacillus (in: firmicutes)]MBC6973923.1 hypothetical protein [Bacillus sp. Xin]NSW39300.1 hypothetical protein [Bacillus sp. Xin1]QLA09671.1 BacA [Bacillus sp. Xin1]